MKLTHWKCSNCRKLKKLREEIDRADLGAICRDCQSGIVAAIDTDQAAGQDAPAFVRRINRRNGKDRRD